VEEGWAATGRRRRRLVAAMVWLAALSGEGDQGERWRRSSLERAAPAPALGRGRGRGSQRAGGGGAGETASGRVGTRRWYPSFFFLEQNELVNT
jgi:hypothetical protein